MGASLRLRQTLGQVGLGLALLFWGFNPSHAQPAPPRADFADWTGFVVAGDWHAHSGAPSEVFDNGRRDIAEALSSAGFDPQNISQFSVRPGRYPTAKPLKTNLKNLSEALQGAAPKPGGCLIYITSHGDPMGIVFGERILTPAMLGALLDQTCGQKPTIAIVSACFSGVFVNPLARPNRMIFTAARSDRTSFGCGEADLYTYFDTCFLSQISQAQDFTKLASQVRTCIALLEQATGVDLASEPQLYLGAQIRPLLTLLQLQMPPPRSAKP
jgi:hypothetical protein